MDQPQVLGMIPRSTHGSMKERRENRTKEQISQALADRPARRGGLSARATQTVRQGTTDCPQRLADRPAWAADCPLKPTEPPEANLEKRTVRGEHADCPPGTRGLSARHTWTVRNLVQPKLENTTDRKRRQARTRRTHDEKPSRGPSATRSRTVHALRTEQKTARPRRSTPPIHHRISQTVEAVETRVWGHEKRQPRMLYPKNFAS
jgi:hypothetical protein